MKECVESDSNTYQYATLHLKNKNVDLAIFFLERGCSISLISEHFRDNKKLGRIAVKNNPKNFQYVNKKSKDVDEIFKLAFQQDKGKISYASERIRKTNILDDVL